MTTEDRDEREGMSPEGDAALWALLGRQKAPGEVSPYFSRRVLREVALAGEPPAAGRIWRRLVPSGLFSRRVALWSGAWSGVCAVGFLGLTLALQVPKSALKPPPSGAPVPAETAQMPLAVDEGKGTQAEEDFAPEPEGEVIADLDNAVQREESRLWTDENSTARF